MCRKLCIRPKGNTEYFVRVIAELKELSISASLASELQGFPGCLNPEDQAFNIQAFGAIIQMKGNDKII